MKRIAVLAAITVISALAINTASAQYNYQAYRDVRHDKADIYNDRARLAQIERDKRAAAFYGDRREYRHDNRAERRVERDIRHDRRDIRRERRAGY